jgi:DNA-binding NarL/FixJ family response regulator
MADAIQTRYKLASVPNSGQGHCLLEFLGLDDSAAAVYRALLSADARLTEISVATRLQETVVHAALGTLAKLGLAVGPASTFDGWRPVRPELAFAALAHKLASRTHQLAAAWAAAAAATAIGSARLQHTEGSFELLGDMQDALAEAGRLAERATKEYLQATPAGPALIAPAHSDLSILESAVARGVSVRVLCHDTARSGGVRIGEPAIVAVLRAVFDNSWDTATPLGAPLSADGSTGLAPGEQALLRLMAAGLTDEAAAKRLGVSLRTVRRQIQALMTRLQATSRFQAGHNAAQRGWPSGIAGPGSNRRFHKHLHSIPGATQERSLADREMRH